MNNPMCITPPPSVLTVQSALGLKGLSNCFVRVLDLATTYYISPEHEIVPVMQSVAEVVNYDSVTNPRGYRNQFVYDTGKTALAYYDHKGSPHTLSFEQ